MAKKQVVESSPDDVTNWDTEATSEELTRQYRDENGVTPELTFLPSGEARGLFDGAFSFLPPAVVTALKAAALREGRSLLEQASQMLVAELKQQGLLKDEDC